MAKPVESSRKATLPASVDGGDVDNREVDNRDVDAQDVDAQANSLAATATSGAYDSQAHADRAADRAFQSQAEYSPLASVLLAVAAGIWCGQYGLRPDISFAMGCLSFALWRRLWISNGNDRASIGDIRLNNFGWAESSASDSWTGLLLLAAILFWTTAYASQKWEWRHRRSLVNLTHSESMLAGLQVEVLSAPVVSRPDARRPMERLRVRAIRIRDGAKWVATMGCGELRVASGSPRPHQPGDRLELWGRLRRPPAADNPGGFNYRQYCRARNIEFLVQVNDWRQTRLIAAEDRFNPRLIVHRLRLRAAQTLHQRLPPEHFPLAAALVIGQREGLDQQQRESFLVAGVMHLLAISGLHVGMLVGMIWKLERIGWLRRRAALFASVVLATMFAVFTGGQPPVVRAAMFVFALTLARSSARECRSLTVISAAALLLLLLNPCRLFDTGVQLSLLAVAVLACYCRLLTWRESTDPLDRLLEASRSGFWQWSRSAIRSVVSMLLSSLAVCLATAPLTSRVFHVVAPAAVMLNVLLAPLTAVVLISGLATVILEDSCGMGWAPAAVCSWSIQAMLWTLEFAEQTPWASIWTGGPPFWWTTGFFLLAGAATWLPIRPNVRLTAALLLMWCLAAPLGRLLESQTERPLRCTVLSMGHGACVLVQLPNGRNLVYDVGSLGSPQWAGRAAANAFWAQRTGPLDAIVISHADSDHFNGLIHVAQRFHVSRLLVSPAFLRNPQAYQTARQLRLQGVLVQPAEDGRQIHLDPQVQIDVLQPVAQGRSSDNAKSLLLKIEYAGQRILLTGDLEAEGMQRLLAGPPQEAEIVLAPHHGSRHSEPLRFLAWSRPRLVIASTGRSRSLTALQAACDAHNAQLRATCEKGAVQICIDASGHVDVHSWRSDPWWTH